MIIIDIPLEDEKDFINAVIACCLQYKKVQAQLIERTEDEVRFKVTSESDDAFFWLGVCHGLPLEEAK